MRESMNKYDLDCFKHEYELLQQFTHSNIVRVFDYIEDESAVYLVMEYLNGSSLMEDLQVQLSKNSGQPFDEEEGLDIFVK